MAHWAKPRSAVVLAALGASLALPVGTAAAATGDLDASFAGGGKLTFAPGGKQTEIDDVAIQPDGKLVLAGWIDQTGSTDFLVVRLNPDGSFDQGFGTAGIATIDFPAKGTTTDTGSGVAIRPDGKIVVGGTSHDNSQGVDRVAVAQLTANGTPDATFNPAGIPDSPGFVGEQLVGINATVNDLVLDSSGRILVAGGWEGGAFFTGIDAYVLRLRSDGVPDSSFNGSGGGGSAFHFGYGDASDKPESVSRIAVQPDGKIVLPGIAANSTNQDAALARVSPGAVLDPDFNGGAFVYGRGDTEDTAQDAALEPDGRILVAGAGFQSNSMMLTRSTSAGPFEKWFNGQTLVSVDFGKPSIANAIALQSNGKIVLGGSAGGDVAVARVDHVGASDSTFGPGGKRTISFPGGDADAFAMALQGDGKVVLAGHSGNSAAVVRLQGDTSGGGPAGPGGPGGPNATVRGPRMTKFTAKVKQGGRSVSFVLRSDQNCTGAISGKTVKAYAAAKKRRVSLGSVRFKLTAGKSKTVVLKLSRKARKLLGRRHSLRVKFTVTLTGSSKTKSASSRTLTLRLARAK